MQREDISIETPEGTFTAYISVPDQPADVAVVILQEIFGVDANIRATADAFAQAGYAVVAPDLFWRQEKGIQLDPATEEGRERAMELMKGFSRDEGVADGAAALAALRSRVPGLERAAAVGYCMGGAIAYLMGARGVTDAGVAYYGVGLDGMLDEMDGLKGRLLLHIAGEDHLCPPEAQQAIKDATSAAGERAQVVVHDGVGHAFARIGGGGFDSAAADRANAMTHDLLAELSAMK